MQFVDLAVGVQGGRVVGYQGHHHQERDGRGDRRSQQPDPPFLVVGPLDRRLDLGDCRRFRLGAALSDPRRW